ncbi:hypothetical protein OHB26_16325 [Nocardia sp. NBC_01503]|uniref:hypothetical protein n=1 Tax=Nocardia sp. NBC_01503 TaxID=2975997 RepID=UPI002E7C0E96|nr:hypothetical protein [Nocardia sp. NBC_01503]WTL35617.1 hypothetical protein OHB26_16325 [Nocardia sp. NBC_01503]
MPPSDIRRVTASAPKAAAPIRPSAGHAPSNWWSTLGGAGSAILGQLLGKPSSPIRFINDSGDSPDLADQNVLGSLPVTPDDAAHEDDRLHPGFKEPGGDYIHGQPKYRSQWWNTDYVPELEIAGRSIQADMKAHGWNMSARLMNSFLNNNSKSLQLTNAETQEAVFNTIWGRSALFYGQDLHWVAHRGDDARDEPEYFTGPDQQNQNNPTIHQDGILDKVNRAIQDVHDQKAGYDTKIPMRVDWLRTPADTANEDNPDVNHALGHFHEGADGYIVVHRGADGGADNYEVHFQAKEWDHYKFDDQPLTYKLNGKVNIGHLADLTAAEFMRMAHQIGVGRNYIDYGTTGDVDVTGVAGSTDMSYSFRDDPNHVAHAMTMQQHYPLNRAAGGDISAGAVRGPGSSIGDKIPAYLSDGEFVVNAASASVNRPLLKAINDDPLYMKKYTQQMETMVAAALTKVRVTPNGRGEHVDRSMTVRVSTYDVHEAFAKAKLWEQRHALLD